MHMSVTSHGPDRGKQINTLLIFNENVSTIQKDVQYRVDFSSNGKPLSLSIHLPPEYPNVRPNVYVEPKGISHPWIREDGLVVGAPGLIRYAQQTDLGRLVQAIKRELERNPPKFLNNNAAISNSASTQGQGSNGFSGFCTYNPIISQGGLSSCREGGTQNHRGQFEQIAPNSDFKCAELQTLPNEKLNELNSSPVALMHFMRTLEKPVAPLDQSLTKLRCEIQDADKFLHQLESDCQSKRDQLLLEVDHYHSAKERLRGTVDEIKEYKSRYSERNLSELMQKASMEDEEKSEACAESFLEGGVDADMFLAKYLQVRTDHHKKRVLSDRRGKQNRET